MTEFRYLLLKTGCSFVTCIFLITHILQDASAQENYLSDTDSGYNTLEKMQEQYCNRRDTTFIDSSIGCKFDKKKCMERSTKLGRKLFGEQFDPKTIEIVCSQISTRYEQPGVYAMLSGYLDDIRLAAADLGMKEVPKIRFGTLPVNEINVRVTDDKIENQHIIVFNLGFFLFANEFAKVTAFTIPFKPENGMISFDFSRDAFEAHLDEYPSKEDLFQETILLFLGETKREVFLPSTIVQPIISVYFQGMEMFAMAHEYAHILHGHVGKIQALEHNTNNSGNLGTKRILSNWVQEIEADYTAFKLIRKIRDKRVETGGHQVRQGVLLSRPRDGNTNTSHPFDIALIATPEFYFIAREITEDARSIIKTGHGLPPPLDVELRVIEIAEECAAMEGSDFLQRLKNEGDQILFELQQHPHLSIRHKLARIWLKDEIISKVDNPIGSITNSLTRNSLGTWARIKPTLIEKYRR